MNKHINLPLALLLCAIVAVASFLLFLNLENWAFIAAGVFLVACYVFGSLFSSWLSERRPRPTVPRHRPAHGLIEMLGWKRSSIERPQDFEYVRTSSFLYGIAQYESPPGYGSPRFMYGLTEIHPKFWRRVRNGDVITKLMTEARNQVKHRSATKGAKR